MVVVCAVIWRCVHVMMVLSAVSRRDVLGRGILGRNILARVVRRRAVRDWFDWGCVILGSAVRCVCGRRLTLLIR
jgi:hypothetical protein